MLRTFGSPVGSPWWRFDRYEIRNGYIRPAKGARLEQYDPFDTYAERAQYRRDQTSASDIQSVPVREFIRIGRRAKERTGKLLPNPRLPRQQIAGAEVAPEQFDPKSYSVDGASEELILDWVRENGLLGISLSRIKEIATALRWHPLTALAEGNWTRTRWESAGSPPAVVPAQSYFQRTRRGWTETLTTNTLNFTPLSKKIAVGKLVDPDAVRQGYINLHVGVIGADGDQHPFADRWARFFPSISNSKVQTFEYPRPESEAFWEIYAEPVFDFVWHARLLAEYERSLAFLAKTPPSAAETAVGFARMLSESLNFELEHLTPSLELRGDGAMGLFWRSPSLLSTLHFCLAQELIRAKRILMCERCHRTFASPTGRDLYCDTRCAHAARKSRLRASAPKPPIPKAKVKSKRKGKRAHSLPRN